MSCWTEPRATESHTLSIRGLLFQPFATLVHTARLFNCCFSIALSPPATLIVVKHSTGFGAFRAIFPAGATAVGLAVRGYLFFFTPKVNLLAHCAVSHTPTVGAAAGNAPASSRFCSKGKGCRQSGQWPPVACLPPLEEWVRNGQWPRALVASGFCGRHFMRQSEYQMEVSCTFIRES
jgi:hypothetical protein